MRRQSLEVPREPDEAQRHACTQADRSGRAGEFADAYAASKLAEANGRLLAGARPGAEGRMSLTSLQELAVTQETVTPFWWGLWVLLKVCPVACVELVMFPFACMSCHAHGGTHPRATHSNDCDCSTYPCLCAILGVTSPLKPTLLQIASACIS